MGEKLETMIKALDQRMDTGVLHDLNATRLHMLIGEEMVKNSINLPDDAHLIEIIEKAMRKYFRMEPAESSKEAQVEIPETHAMEHPTKEKEEEKTEIKPVVQPEGPIHFKLNIRKNNLNQHAIINQVPVLFSPEPLQQSLAELLEKTYQNEATVFETQLSNMASLNSEKMLRDVIQSIPSGLLLNQKIRLGYILFKLLGFGDFHMKIRDQNWEITIKPAIVFSGYQNFILGYSRGIMNAAEPDSLEKFDIHMDYDTESVRILITRL